VSHAGSDGSTSAGWMEAGLIEIGEREWASKLDSALKSLPSSLVPRRTFRHTLGPSERSFLLRRTVRDVTARAGRPDQTTQIYEGTNQIQRMVIAKRLLG
jgi:hypothetical protein